MVKFIPLIGAEVSKGQNGTLDGTLDGTLNDTNSFTDLDTLWNVIGRNPVILILQVVFRAGYVETWGRGIEKM